LDIAVGLGRLGRSAQNRQTREDKKANGRVEMGWAGLVKRFILGNSGRQRGVWIAPLVTEPVLSWAYTAGSFSLSPIDFPNPTQHKTSSI